MTVGWPTGGLAAEEPREVDVDAFLGYASSIPSESEEATGLSEAQVDRLLDGPSDEPVVTLELFGADGAASALLEALATVQAELGARLRWSGELALQVLGTAEPGFELIVATEYPSRDCVFSTFADVRVVEARADAASAGTHWIYSAATTESLGMSQ